MINNFQRTLFNNANSSVHFLKRLCYQQWLSLSQSQFFHKNIYIWWSLLSSQQGSIRWHSDKTAFSKLTETPFFVSMSAICFFDSIHPILPICLFSTISFTISVSILRRLSETYLDDFKASTKDRLSVINSFGRYPALPNKFQTAKH